MGREEESFLRTAQMWASQFSSIAIQIALFIGLGYLGDQHWGTSPWLFLTGAGFATFVAFYYLWKLVHDKRFRE